ncbi:MAG: ThiF family adenylyltransferase [Methyloprofundus sp.]|nr:ThiF family adenylyltransferase [Methyloprofundus sp.]
MIDKKLKLQDTLDIYISEQKDGKVIITFSRMTTRERKEIVTQPFVAKFLASLDGERTAGEILKGLGDFSKEQASILLNFLKDEHFIYEAHEAPEDPRYLRQIAYFEDMILSHSGMESQRLLQQKHIAIIGCGAVTGAMVEILARAGVEKFTLVDAKKVRYSDLVRHLFCRLDDIGKYKIDILSDYLKRINNRIKTALFYDELNPNTDLNKYIGTDVDLVINGCDEPYLGHTSLKIGRFLQTKNIALYVMGGFDAHLMSSGELIIPPKTPCIDCCQQTFQKALTDWKPTYTQVEKPEQLVEYNNHNYTINKMNHFDIGGSGGLSVMSLFSANLSCMRIIQFLAGDDRLDYKTERYEYLINKGIMTSFEMVKQRAFCKVCNE